MDIFRTLGRGARSYPMQGQNVILLSGIVCVTLNQKSPQPKFVEVTHNAVEKKTALYIHRTRDKRRTEAALDLTQATVFVENETPDVVGIINRDNRIYTLKLQKDKEDLERFVAQWRSVLTVSQNPDDMFSVITVSGEDRGCVILISAYDHESHILFKHMSGLQKNSEFRLSQFVKLDKLSTHEVSLEARSGEVYHFISKRSDALIRKLQRKFVEEDLTQSLPTKSHNNNTALYDSKQGYTPTFQQSREVSHVPADYLTMDQVNLPPPSPRLEKRAPPPRLSLPDSPDSRVPPPRSPGVPRRSVPPPPSRSVPGYTLPDNFQGRNRSLVEEAPDYIPMDTRSGLEQGRVAPQPQDQDDYLSMDDMSLSNNPQDDYLTMDGMSLSNNPLDDYLSMGGPGMRDFPCDLPPPIQDPDYTPFNNPCGLSGDHVDYLPMDKGYHDPLIADYLSMDQLANDQKFDSYPSHESREDSDIGFEEDEEDIYFDPGLAPPPVPPRIDEKPTLPPPRIDEKPALPPQRIDEKPALPPPRIDEKPALPPPRSRSDLPTKSSSLSGPESSPDKNGSDSGEDQTHMSHSEVMELLQKLREKGPRGSLTNPKTVYCEVVLQRPSSPRIPLRGNNYELQQPRHRPQLIPQFRPQLRPQLRPQPRPTVYSDVQIRIRNSMSESSAPAIAPGIRRHSEMPTSLHTRQNSGGLGVPDSPPPLPNSYTEVELRRRPDVSPSRNCTTPLPSRRISEQPHHLPRPRSTNLDGFSIEPVLPPRTDKDQLRQKLVPVKVDQKKRKKKKSSAVQQPFREDGVPSTSPPPPPPPPVAVEHVYTVRPDRPVRGPGYLGNGAVPPPLVPRKLM